MTTDFNIEILACVTCNNAILQDLGSLQGVFGATIDRINGKISIIHTDEISRDSLKEKLSGLGFKIIED
ncbi:copper chaperone CopZ [Balneicella halophila]|uniref:Copper chaperone CopZ n=1 Tax=Balneicella halophila TaxID=1537566 RepID=A0A7L4UPA0_BALHA|nr:heavy metal-associated domain-containing protein [Balneicella halophila]PVX51000.1 copper chaperone CopZ [Balneicella halophila]